MIHSYRSKHIQSCVSFLFMPIGPESVSLFDGLCVWSTGIESHIASHQHRERTLQQRRYWGGPITIRFIGQSLSLRYRKLKQRFGGGMLCKYMSYHILYYTESWSRSVEVIHYANMCHNTFSTIQKVEAVVWRWYIM